MSNRKHIPIATKHEVSKRDYQSCRKCGYDLDLQIHHIQPVDAEGGNEPENLITLCGSCHREWEMLAKPKNLTFEQWLELPSAGALLAFFADPTKWADDMSAKEARSLILSTHQILKNIPRGD